MTRNPCDYIVSYVSESGSRATRVGILLLDRRAVSDGEHTRLESKSWLGTRVEECEPDACRMPRSRSHASDESGPFGTSTYISKHSKRSPIRGLASRGGAGGPARAPLGAAS